MGHRYAKGSRRPGPTDNPGRHAGDKGYQLSGGVPWPELGDATPYADAIQRVVHLETGEAGTLRSVEWATPEGAFMHPDARHTKTKTPRLNPGAWWGVVSWDNRETWEFPLKTRQPLDALGVADVENSPAP